MINKVLVSMAALLALAAGEVHAEGKLHFFNWGNYTSPDVIEEFEETYDVEVTIDDYDSNDSMLAKIKQGGAGYDLAVPSGSYVQIMREEGLLEPAGVNQMENYQNVLEAHRSPYWDPEREYSAPWHWGTTGISVDTAVYKGDVDTWALIFDPPDVVKGRVHVLSEMNDVMAAGLFYLGYPQCNDNKEQLRELNDLLQGAKPHWRTIGYGIIEKLVADDVDVAMNWNGASLRARRQVPAIQYAYPKEGISGWADNVVLLKGAPNPENAKLFMNFIMQPRIAAMMTEFSGYANSIKGSEQHMSEETATAPEIVPPTAATEPTFIPACRREVSEIYTKIWNDLLK